MKCIYFFRFFSWFFLLIVPEGIEILAERFANNPEFLLIVPEGIEIASDEAALKQAQILLIVPEGIEMEVTSAIAKTMADF